MPPQTYTLEQAMGLAVAHHQAGRLAEAEAIYRQILGAYPQHASAMHNLGEIACRVGKFDIAMDLVNRALAIEPNNPINLNTMAVILFSLGRPEQSFAVCQRALALNPNFANAHANLGICYADQGNLPASIAAFEKAIQLDPSNACAHDGLGLSLLMNGQLQRGWREQEWRWEKHTFAPRRFTGSTHWQGQNLAGKTIFLYVEQGYGDVIQFCRYVPLLEQRGAKVLLEKVPEMAKLLSTLPGLSGLVDAGSQPFDLACPLMSVPLWYGTELGTIPSQVPYLQPDPALVSTWWDYFQTDNTFKIGIAWAGRPSHANDRNRSTVLNAFAPLASIPGITFYSLQKGPPAAQLANAPAGMKIIDLSPRLEDLNVTAAVISQLDLVISVDTVVVHLAGAMNKPVWNLLPFCPDWRWMLNRTDTPWYPSMKLFRLPRRDDWPAVMDRVKSELGQIIQR